jgi:hypothetical protein
MREQDLYILTQEGGVFIMKVAIIVSALGLCLTSYICNAADKDERGGTCADAKSQYKYFCDREGHQQDIMMNAPIACNNAKRNMAAACDGESEEDFAYEFTEGTPNQ